ncbi:hypothetical protein HY625_02535 [Candidatus Uhrbacteria bacterium]|nr:hypothetical protein [Candidatus Uhrbacteria bacterium]
MITVNLLSPEKRRESVTRRIFHHAKTLLEATLFFALLIAIVTIGTKLLLLDTVLTVTSSPTANIRTRDLEVRIRRVNAATALLARLQGQTIPWSGLLIRLSGIVPPGIRFNELTLDTKTTPHLLLKGKAATRQDLLVLKTALEKLPFVTNLSFPITNLLSPKDIDWQLDATIDLARL